MARKKGVARVTKLTSRHEAVGEIDGPLMTHEQFLRELHYQVALYFVKQMRKKSDFSDVDFQLWRGFLIRVCNPPIGKMSCLPFAPGDPGSPALLVPAGERSAVCPPASAIDSAAMQIVSNASQEIA